MYMVADFYYNRCLSNFAGFLLVFAAIRSFFLYAHMQAIFV